MIAAANPINWKNGLNQGLQMWAINPSVSAQPAYFPELVHKRHGAMVNMVQAITTGWGNCELAGAPGQNGLGLDGSSMYVLMPQPPNPGGSFSAFAQFAWVASDNFANVASGRRTNLGNQNSAWYIQHRSTTGMAVAVLATDATFVLLDLGNFNVSGRYSIGLSYDGSSRRTLGYINGPAATRTVATGTLAADRDPHTSITLGAAEFDGVIFNFRIHGINGLRLWNRPLSEREFDEVYQDERNGFKGTLNRDLSRGRKPWFIPPPNPIPNDATFAAQSTIRSRQINRLGNVYARPSQSEIDPTLLMAANPEQQPDKFQIADWARLFRDRAALPKGNYWKEPSQGATDVAALMVPNPEQEQSKLDQMERASQIARRRRALYATYWMQPVQAATDPNALSTPEYVDSTYAQDDMQNTLPHAAWIFGDRRRTYASTFGQTDLVTLALAELVTADRWTTPFQYRLWPRQPVTFTYGWSQLEETLIPEDPEATILRAWFSPFTDPVRLPVGRRPRYWSPVGTLDLDEADRPEVIRRQFEGPWLLPAWRRAVRGHYYPAGELQMDPADRLEAVTIDKFRRLFDDPARPRPRILVANTLLQALVIDPANVNEVVTIDKFHREMGMPVLRRAPLNMGALRAAAEEFEPSTFSFARLFKLAMLSAGFAKGEL